MGFKGFKVESTEVKSNIYDLIKDLSKEEWDWIEMDPKVVENFEFVEPHEWEPSSDPRPDWKIEEIRNQTKKEDTPTNLGKEEIQPEQLSAEIVGLTGSNKTRQSDNQNFIVQVTKTTKYSEDKNNGDTSQKSETKENESDSNQSHKTRDTKITKPKSETKNESDLDQSHKIRDTKPPKPKSETKN